MRSILFWLMILSTLLLGQHPAIATAIPTPRSPSVECVHPDAPILDIGAEYGVILRCRSVHPIIIGGPYLNKVVWHVDPKRLAGIPVAYHNPQVISCLKNAIKPQTARNYLGWKTSVVGKNNRDIRLFGFEILPSKYFREGMRPFQPNKSAFRRIGGFNGSIDGSLAVVNSLISGHPKHSCEYPQTSGGERQQQSKDGNWRPRRRAPKGFGWLLLCAGLLGAVISFVFAWVVSDMDRNRRQGENQGEDC